MALGHAVDDIGEIGLGIEAVELRRLQHGVADRGTLTTRIGGVLTGILSG